MRHPILALLLILTTGAHAQQWNWAVDAGGSGNTDYCFGIATDSQGNVYWCGSVSGTADFGCATIAPGNNVVGVLAKYDASGNCQWVRSMGTTFNYSWTYNVAIDAQDRIYVTGSYNGNATFGSGVTLASMGSDDIFLARYNALGDCLWAHRAGSSGSSDEARGIALSDDGSIFICGFSGGTTISFDGISIPNPTNYRQIVVARYDSTGAVQWAEASAGNGQGKNARAISVAGDRLFVTGQVGFNTTTFDGLSLSPTSNATYLFVMACDLDGNGLWARSYGNGDHEGYGIAADTLGNLFVTGRMWGTLYLPDDTLTSVSSNDDILLMGLDQDGNYRWAKSTGTTQRDLAWSVVPDGQGNAYVAAQFNSTIDFFGTPLTSNGAEDMIISKIEADGDMVWARRAGGGDRDIALAIHRQQEAPHALYFGGYFWGVVTYGSSTIEDVLNGDAMLIGASDTTFDVSALAMATCPGTCDGTAIAFSEGDGPFTFAWNTGETTQEITGLCPGMYIVEVSDVNGQVHIDTLYVNEVADPGYAVQQNGNVLFIDGGSGYEWYADDLLIPGADSSSIQAGVSGMYSALVTTAEGCVFSSDTLNYISVGVPFDAEKNELVVFPSPADDHITVRASGPIVQALAVSVTGASIPLRLDAWGQCDIHMLAAGAYALRVRFHDGSGAVRTFVKE